MAAIGTIDSVWRYPVKGMRGEELREGFVGFGGLYGDRVWAIRNSSAPEAFPFLTARELERLLQHRPHFRDAAAMGVPPNLAAAEGMGPGVTPLYAPPEQSIVDVETPEGDVLAIDDPRLLAQLHSGFRERDLLTLIRSDRALTDCRPVSLFSIQTSQQLGTELGAGVDKRRFRANLYLDLPGAAGFSENGLVGKMLQVGGKVRLQVLELDARCKMITLDPDTSEHRPEIARHLAKNHQGCAGLYAAVLVEGMVRAGDAVSVL